MARNTVTRDTATHDCTRVLEQSVTTATDDHLLKAAEAVVDAALCCYSAQQSDSPTAVAEVSPETRQMLIAAVLQNPILTPHLFNKYVIEVLSCG